ncbi:MAG TPA: DUF5939 domain-containing protein [Aggregatilineales bacterium]|nr:DUF5939 domain-containing protein [Aggregatilineales bacterium]
MLNLQKITFHYRWQWILRSSVESLWDYVTDSDRYREATAFPAAIYTDEQRPDGSTRRIGRLRMYGMPIEWEEEPFEWVRHQDMIDTQNYRIGPLSYVRVHLQLERRPEGGTLLTYAATVRPGNILGLPAIPIQIGMLHRWRTQYTFKQIDDYIQATAREPFPARHTPVSSSGRTRLPELSNQLVAAGHSAALVGHLIDTIRISPDHDLTRMRPFALADQWKTDRHATLELFLQATKVGLLDLSWDMLCPECRGAKHKAEHLHDVNHAAFCPSCNIHYEVDFAHSVEATFQVNSAVKAIRREEFCVGSPQNTPHILAQQILAPGESRAVSLELEERNYRWRVPEVAMADPTVRTANTMQQALKGRVLLSAMAGETATEATLTVHDDDIHLEPETVGSGRVTFTLKNESAAPKVALLEQTEWSDQASTAAEVTSLQSFRDLFSSEALRPGESIGVERMAFLFTDLKGSTSLYQTVGDAPAFRQVMDHFTLLREGVTRNHGALVKTIGDAIMAVFSDPLYALEATLDILQRIQDFNARNPALPLVLKMGVHQGTCIAVTLNERLDYFGSVVNLAARLEGQSLGNDLVISEAVATDPAVAQFIAASAGREIHVEPFEASLKGFAETFSLRRLTLTKQGSLLPAQRQQSPTGIATA